MTASELKRNLTPEDVILFVTKELGSNGYLTDNEGNLIFQTICHNRPGEGKYKLYYYIESQFFHCYTECGESFDIYGLIEKTGRASNFVEAYYVLADFFGVNPYSKNVDFDKTPDLISDWDLFNKYDALYNTIKEDKSTKILPQNLTDFYAPCIPKYWLEEGIGYEAMQKYNIRMDFVNQHIIIPHYDINGQLIGIRNRSFNPEEIEKGMKYSPVWIEDDCLNHPLGEHLYGLNFNKDMISKSKKAVIVESEKSVMLAETYYPGHNFVVACCGSNISETQINLLLQTGVQEIIIAFDKENDCNPASEKSIKYKEKLISLAQKFAMYVNVYIVYDSTNVLNEKDSPFDKGKETLEYLLERKILVPCIDNILINKNKRGK